MDRRITIGLLLLAMLTATPVLASFGASDLLYVPVVSHTTGASGIEWRTDLYITNVSDVPVDVAMIYLPSGLVSNANLFVSRETWLGGREDDLFGLIDESLADIPPGGSVVIREIVGEYWEGRLGFAGNGALVVAGYEAGTLDETSEERVLQNIIVNARIYAKARQWVEDPENEGEFLNKAARYGQLMPGVPWYNFVDGGAVTDTYDRSYELLTGGEEGGGLRYNVGVVNASDVQTTLTVRIQPFQADGTPFLDEDEVEIFTTLSMPPASHVQLFRPFREDWDLDDIEGAVVRVSIEAWSSLAASPRPMLTSYGSVVANNTGDPSTVLPSFADAYDIECIWGGGDGALKSGFESWRPVEIPAIR